jgi:hypothetical protein
VTRCQEGLPERPVWLVIKRTVGATPANPATTSFTPVRHSADWIFAGPNLLFRRAIHDSKCYHVLHLVVF